MLRVVSHLESVFFFRHPIYSAMHTISLPQLPPSAPFATSALLDHLRTLPGLELRTARHDRMLYATDASLYQVEPLAVVIPHSIEAARNAFHQAAHHRVPILPRGGGTSLAGQCTNHAIILDTSRHCRALLDFDPAQGRCTVEPGITIDELNAHLAAHHKANPETTHWFFSPDPATSRHACIGGCIGNNAAGARSLRYGRTSEHIHAIEAMLANGSIAPIRFAPNAGRNDPRAARLAQQVAAIVRRCEHLIRERFPKTIRRNAGYALDAILAQLDAGVDPIDLNLAPLLCGSEGTLAFTLKATLDLDPVPTRRCLALLAFDSLDAAIEAVVPIVNLADPTEPTTITAVELLDDMILTLARSNTTYRPLVDALTSATPPGTPPPAAMLYIELSTWASQASADAPDAAFAPLLDQLRLMLEPNPLQVFDTPDAMADAWKLRKAGEPLLHSIPALRKPVTFVEDNAVPVEHLAEFVSRFRAIVEHHHTTAAFFAHASVGVLHVRPLLDLHDAADRNTMQAIAMEVADLARSLGGVMSGEHGDGRVRSPLLLRFFGPELINAFKDIKTLFDPHNLLNPGNIVSPANHAPLPYDITTITDQLRIGPDATPERPVLAIAGIETYHTFDDQHGLAGAVEMCNGAGICRKKRLANLPNATMCPSYQATLDERHSPRGRANALRLAFSGQLSDTQTPDFNDPDTKTTLDLCLSCKACKSECPSNVDIARLKAEYLAQSYKAAGHEPLRALVLGHIRTINQLGSRFPGLANTIASSALNRFIATRLLNIAPKRSLPCFSVPLTKRLARVQHRAARAQSRTCSMWNIALSPDQLTPNQPAAVIFADCFTTYNEPSIGMAAAAILHAFGYQIGLADAGCCARSLISTGLLAHAQTTIASTASTLATWLKHPQVQSLIVLEPSCLSAITDDWLALNIPGVPLSTRQHIAERTSTLEAFLDRHWSSHPIRPAIDADHPLPTPLYHAHCHQKALGNPAEDTAIFARLGCPSPAILDTGCCGMAGSFGFDRDNYPLSIAIFEQSVRPELDAHQSSQANPRPILVPGTSCRAQFAHCQPHSQAAHPLIYLADRLNALCATDQC